MTKLQLGPIGVSVLPADGDDFRNATAELADLGYATIWVAGGALQRLQQLADVVDATRTVQVGSGIISVDRFDRAAVAAAYAEIEARHPGRFLVGLGGAHGPRPLRTLAGYLDALDSVPPRVPAASRVLAALGPRMLELARDRAAGAYSFLVTPGYTAQARALLGEHVALVVGQFAAVEPDPRRARELARGRLRFLSTAGGYAANLRRMGFSEDEIAQLADRLIDGVVAWGDLDAIAERVGQHLAAGADQVALSVLSAGPPGSLPTRQWRQLAQALVA
ncbi:MAG TPA: TIGR03620 family F420-dependent LLM class oxidoreductase [Actinomycetes bacterium]|jgi:probable F420-dependent oxidoreductase|nr:TIGR03620 family F420-dependent LLM class oxidoreductase [Actinomycetes bacterium]